MRSGGVRNLCYKVSAYVTVTPRILPLHLPEGALIDYFERPLRIENATGPRVAFALSELKDGMAVANFTLCAKPSQIRNHIQVSSVHTFKGLESRVVILVEVDPQASHDLDAVLYVGCSRARTYLIILYDGALDEETKSKITGTF